MARLPATARRWLDWTIAGALAVILFVVRAWPLGL